jgi:hypothetical protein
MSDHINAKVKVGKADRSKVLGSEIESDKQSLGTVDAGVEVTEAEDSEIKGAKLRLIHSDEDELTSLRQDFQLLLEYLSQNDVTRSSDVATPAIKKELEKKPKLKQRLINAVKAGGVETLKVIFEHPLVSISTEAIKAFLEDS